MIEKAFLDKGEMKYQLHLLTTSLLGPVPWISYAIDTGLPLPFATSTQPSFVGFPSHGTLPNSGCARISAALSCGISVVLMAPFETKSCDGRSPGD